MTTRKAAATEIVDETIVDLTDDEAPEADAIAVDVDEDDDADLPKRAVRNTDGSITVPLRYPVSIRVKQHGTTGEEVLSELRFHRMTGADMAAINAAGRSDIAPMAFARSSRLQVAKVKAWYLKMDAADIGDCDRVVGFFAGSGQRTGR